MRIEVTAVLFDSDGVLIDSHHQVLVAWKQLSDEFDLDYEKLLGELAGVRSEDTLGRYLPPERARQAVGRLEDLEVELARGSRPLPGALHLLDKLPAESWTIVTSGSRRLAESRWRGAGIPIPPRVITAEDVAAGKPDPEPYLAAARLLEVDPRSCVVFEDSPAGGAAGEAAGATVIAVGNQPWKTEPEARVDDLSRVTAGSGGPPIELILDR